MRYYELHGYTGSRKGGAMLNPALQNAIGTYMIAGVLSVVWLILIWVSVQVIRIAKAGN